RAKTRPAQPGDRRCRWRAAASVLTVHGGGTGPGVGRDDRPREKTRPSLPEGRDGRIGDRGLPAQAPGSELEVIDKACLPCHRVGCSQLIDDRLVLLPDRLDGRPAGRLAGDLQANSQALARQATLDAVGPFDQADALAVEI